MEVDLFAEEPIAFEELWQRAEQVTLSTTAVRIASIDDLIEMKQRADRPQDRADIASLQEISRQRKEDW